MKNEPIKKDSILLIDTLNFIYRGVIKFGKKENENGKEDFTIVYNFFRNLRALIEQFKPNKCFLALEGIPHFRYKLYPEYKANRLIKTGSKKEATRADFNRQRDIILSLVKHLPLWKIKAEAYEADDVLFTLAQNLKSEDVTIISADSDLIQIIQQFPTIKLYNAISKSTVSSPNYNYLVQKSIAGDTSDNIPRILSKEKAIEIASDPKLLSSFLEVEENRANFSLNKELIVLREVPDQELLIEEHQVNFDLLKQEFEKMELPSLLKENYWERFTSTFQELR